MHLGHWSNWLFPLAVKFSPVDFITPVVNTQGNITTGNMLDLCR